MVIDMKLAIVTNYGDTIEYGTVTDIKYIERIGGREEITFYSFNENGFLQYNWQYLNDISSIVLTED